jgi:CysZ protein
MKTFNILSDFVLGFSTPWMGLGHLRRHPRLWRYALAPVILNLLLSLLAGLALVWGGREAADWVAGQLGGGKGGWLLKALAYAALFLAFFGAWLALWVLFQALLCAWFYARLALEVELGLGMKREELSEPGFLKQAKDGLAQLLALLSIAFGCFLLGWVPLLGPPLALGLGSYFNFMTLGVDYLDYPMALRGKARGEQRAFARRHKAATLGLGASVLLLALIPVLNSLLLTTAAAGSVLLYRRLEARDEALRDSGAKVHS